MEFNLRHLLSLYSNNILIYFIKYLMKNIDFTMYIIHI